MNDCRIKQGCFIKHVRRRTAKNIQISDKMLEEFLNLNFSDIDIKNQEVFFYKTTNFK